MPEALRLFSALLPVEFETKGLSYIEEGGSGPQLQMPFCIISGISLTAGLRMILDICYYRLHGGKLCVGWLEFEEAGVLLFTFGCLF